MTKLFMTLTQQIGLYVINCMLSQQSIGRHSFFQTDIGLQYNHYRLRGSRCNSMQVQFSKTNSTLIIYVQNAQKKNNTEKNMHGIGDR